jgi:hypothetical protein
VFGLFLSGLVDPFLERVAMRRASASNAWP